ncbi:hypothetical protein APR41_14130 [Salegentibacter salinarum]|uniref:Uncharacterized protein n=1 Tax=Salegentibacter salinarum TaxID=447422 RepID=A0A2N0U083_9FLAO|nr:hypothetical protein [Salegentibacter salinarum]PKD20411.1 hypothetical protein APR41_14130 [Salegentibacter salinarum]SKB85079.1 hypothetical protein SAMN05660903_02865 [Salegentibacter salinarum]
MENEKYLKDISDIKHLMSRSSRFISLSGLAGVFAGCYAILGTVVAEILLAEHNSAIASLRLSSINAEILMRLFLVAIAVLVLAIVTAVFLTTRKAKKTGEKTWDSTSKRLLINFFAPLTAGGIFCLVLLQYGLIGLIAPCMLIFYGLALIHASKYTFGDLRSLGYSNLILGLIATQFLSYGLYFWAIGFGLFHIVYGIWMYNKYDRRNA